jgi:AcrR family transcriptional regulator
LPARKPPTQRIKRSAAPRRGRRPGPSTTREEILHAAREAFAANDYTRTTLREIAKRAKVDPALVIQFFTNKDTLFAAAMELPFDSERIVSRVLDGGRRTLGRRLVRAFLEIWDDPETGSRMLALVRSAATHELAAERLRELVQGQILGPIAAALDAPDADLRANLVGSQLVGLGFARYVMRLEPLASTPREELEEFLGPTVQRYFTGRY